EKMESEIIRFIGEHNLAGTNVDLVLSGKAGDSKLDGEMDSVISAVFPSTPVGVFKHLCGEYFTASSFALWLAYSILKNEEVPPVVLETSFKVSLKTILIYNRYLEDHHSLMLVTR